MQNILKIILMIASCAAILMVMVQPSKTDGIASTISGSELGLFKEKKARGMERTVEILTWILTALFLSISYALLF